MLIFFAQQRFLGRHLLTSSFTQLDFFQFYFKKCSFNYLYLGCNYGKDITKQMFLDLDKVGYTYQVKGKSDINSCVRQCCSHETCNIAFFEGKVNIFVVCFSLSQPEDHSIRKMRNIFDEIFHKILLFPVCRLRTSLVIEFCHSVSHQMIKILPHT